MPALDLNTGYLLETLIVASNSKFLFPTRSCWTTIFSSLSQHYLWRVMEFQFSSIRKTIGLFPYRVLQAPKLLTNVWRNATDTAIWRGEERLYGRLIWIYISLPWGLISFIIIYLYLPSFMIRFIFHFSFRRARRHTWCHLYFIPTTTTAFWGRITGPKSPVGFHGWGPGLFVSLLLV